MSRDSYCTPRFITKRLPEVDLDPCSNSRSTVKARKKICLEDGGNGLLVSWRDLSLFINPPFSDVMPFALKAEEAASRCFLVHVDPTTEWWKVLTQWESYRFDFYDRIDYDPPPEIEISTDDRPSCLICDPFFRERIGSAFAGLGVWWKNYV